MPILAFIILSSSIINLLLGFTIFIVAKKDKANIAFFLFALVCSVWTFNNFYLKLNPNTISLRLAYGMGAFVACTGLIWIYFFLKKEIPNIIKWLIMPASIAVFFITSFTNYVIEDLISVEQFGYETEAGIFFGVYSLYFGLNIFLIIFNLIAELRKNKEKTEKLQIIYVLVGASLFCIIALLVSFLIPIMFNNFGFTAFDNIGLSLFLIFIVYAITRHHLFDIKVIATELLTFAIWLILLVKTFLSQSFHDWLLNGALLVAMVVFGLLLIKSVLKEVKQREKMEEMAGDLEKAFEAEKIAKERIEEAKVEDEALLGSIGDGVVAVDKESKVMFINRAAEAMLGFKPEEKFVISNVKRGFSPVKIYIEHISKSIRKLGFLKTTIYLS